MSKSKSRDIAIVIAFPDNWAKGEKLRDRLLYKFNITYTLYYRVGHAAILLINSATQLIEYFDYGRYITAPGKGRARSKETDPKLTIPIKAAISSKGEVKNLFEIMNYLETIRDATHGYGHTVFSVCENIDFIKAKSYVGKLIARGSIKYKTFGFNGLNCSSFIANIIKYSCEDRKVRSRFYYSETIAPTPLGNVVNASINGQIRKLYKGEFETLQMNRIKVLRNIYSNLSLSLKKNKHLEDSINNFKMAKEIDGLNIPEKAQFLSSLGESTWMHIYLDQTCDKGEYLIESYTENGVRNYIIVGELECGEFNIDAAYKFTYDCNRLKTIILQNENRFVFNYKRNHLLYGKQL